MIKIKPVKILRRNVLKKKNSTRKETVNKIIDFPSHLRHLSPSIIEANILEACLVYGSSWLIWATEDIG